MACETLMSPRIDLNRYSTPRCTPRVPTRRSAVEKQVDDESSPWSSLPNELLIHIFLFLEPSDVNGRQCNVDHTLFSANVMPLQLRSLAIAGRRLSQICIGAKRAWINANVCN